jgi:hypothetical protein
MVQVAAPIVASGPLTAGGEPGDTLLVIPTPSPAVSQLIAGMAGQIQGWSFRDVGATTGSNQEKSTSTAIGAAIAVVLTDTAGEQTYITGFDVTLGIAAAAATVDVTVTGLTNPLNYEITAETTGEVTLSIRFPTPLPGTAITVSLPAVGGAAAANAVTVYGTDTASVQGVLELWDGEGTGGVFLAAIPVPPGGANTQSLLAGTLPFRGGLYLNVVAGSVRGAIYVRV